MKYLRSTLLLLQDIAATDTVRYSTTDLAASFSSIGIVSFPGLPSYIDLIHLSSQSAIVPLFGL